MLVNEHKFLEVICGRQSGVAPALLRGLLSLLEPFYLAGAQSKNFLFDTGLKKPQRVSSRVISIGNVTTGGTGKTPTVAWMCDFFERHRLRPGIVSRGYRSLDDEGNDEHRLLQKLCPNVPHFQNRDRVAAARQLIDSHHPNVIILDDGFQHRRLHRDLDVVLIDCLNPWGYGHVLPRGLLRESARGLSRASIVLLTRADQVTEAEKEIIRQQVRSYTDCPVVSSRFVPTGLRNSGGEIASFSELQDQKVFAFSAIGHPEAFRRTLNSVGFELDDDRFLQFPDHHHYSAEDLSKILKTASAKDSVSLMTTAKDLVKIGDDRIGDLPVWAIEISLEILDSQAVWEETLLNAASDERLPES
ncbi:Tetraacyldisaccharide 4'-kinase [Thalassoglobus neptunius]|uniref:Tetraacyldisaccharide 4'-kinase n=1 Tax=Thalassoglobus neptunius TaxID=1938619 RepID=A0A5C5X5R4_9PLAN|nr:tetraacyldisaccharide 4'-kinase [Thalassoglobus neptunius]TWT58366.1 Tetraacyldisaccharide 4'-kinase [Thalassoglobus neptunius]